MADSIFIIILAFAGLSLIHSQLTHDDLREVKLRHCDVGWQILIGWRCGQKLDINDSFCADSKPKGVLESYRLDEDCSVLAGLSVACCVSRPDEPSFIFSNCNLSSAEGTCATPEVLAESLRTECTFLHYDVVDKCPENSNHFKSIDMMCCTIELPPLHRPTSTLRTLQTRHTTVGEPGDPSTSELPFEYILAFIIGGVVVMIIIASIIVMVVMRRQKRKRRAARAAAFANDNTIPDEIKPLNDDDLHGINLAADTPSKSPDQKDEATPHEGAAGSTVEKVIYNASNVAPDASEEETSVEETTRTKRSSRKKKVSRDVDSDEETTMKSRRSKSRRESKKHNKRESESRRGKGDNSSDEETSTIQSRKSKHRRKSKSRDMSNSESISKSRKSRGRRRESSDESEEESSRKSRRSRSRHYN